MTRKITIPDNLAGDLQVYAKACIPEKSIDEVAVGILQLGINVLDLQYKAESILKANPGTQ